jgi:hypothetical protein
MKRILKENKGIPWAEGKKAQEIKEIIRAKKEARKDEGGRQGSPHRYSRVGTVGSAGSS